MRHCCWYQNKLMLTIIFYYLFAFCCLSNTSWKILSTVEAFSTSSSLEAPTNNVNSKKQRVAILGGTGNVGKVVAIQLLQRKPTWEVILVGRRDQDNNKVTSVIDEIVKSSSDDDGTKKVISDNIEYKQISNVWNKDCPKLQQIVKDADCLIHTVGPYQDQKPLPLQLAIESNRCKVYVDVSDPLDYLDAAVFQTEAAKKSETLALVACGAYPGLSNVLALEAADLALSSPSASTTDDDDDDDDKSDSIEQQHEEVINDVRFNFFAAGLAGLGEINLYITNLGFGESLLLFDNGKVQNFPSFSGLSLGTIDFYLPNLKNNKGNDLVRDRVGSRTIFAWPFPEATTVPNQLQINGNSYAAMGTAPDIWNIMLAILVNVVPRPWWKNNTFSKFMAMFSQPLVSATDRFLDVTGTGELHAMRIDVTTTSKMKNSKDSSSSTSSSSKVTGGVSLVQAHDSLVVCAGQSCAEFAIDALLQQEREKRYGVYLPEQFYKDTKDRQRIIPALTSTPGTFCYTGPIRSTTEKDLRPPSGWFDALDRAREGS